MEPKKNIKKHNLVEPRWTIELSQRELMGLINQISGQIHISTRRGHGNWVVMGSDAKTLFEEAITQHDNVELGDWRIEDGTYVQDVTITPTRPVEYSNFTLTSDTSTFT